MADTTSTAVSDFNPTVKPYITNLLQAGQALTDVSQRPYQYYGNLTPEQQGKFLTGAQMRTAQFTPMQLQAFQNAQNMTANPISQQAGLGALTAGQNYFGAATNPYAVAALMNPYQQGVTDIAKREAIRQNEIAGQGRNAAAVKAGAFGGSRQAIENAEAQRNLEQRLSDLQTQGGQQAYNQAMQALGQGTQYGLQGAATAGTIGQNLFQQGLGINELQAGYGATQQAQTQGILDKAYQDYLTQQQYPYQQLSYMSDLLRGPSAGMTSSTGTSYAAPASLGQNLLGLGATALGAAGQAGGFSNLFSGIGSLFAAEGGQVKSYAEGGTVKGYAEGGMPSIDKLSAMVNQMSDPQLQLALQAAKDAVSVAVIQGAIQKRAQARQAAALQQGAMKANAPTVKEQVMQGLASAELPEDMYNDTAMARGGIVAFNGEDNDQVTRSEDGSGTQSEPLSLSGITADSESPYALENAAAVVNPNYRGHGITSVTPPQQVNTAGVINPNYRGHGITSVTPPQPVAPPPRAAGTGIAAAPAANPVKQAVAQTIPMPQGMSKEEYNSIIDKKVEQLNGLSTKLFDDMNADINKREGALSDKAKQNVYMGLMQFGIQLLSDKKVDRGQAASTAFGDYAKAQAADAAAKDALADKRIALQKYEIETKKGNIDAAEKAAEAARRADLDLKQLQITSKHYDDQIAVQREHNKIQQAIANKTPEGIQLIKEYAKASGVSFDKALKDVYGAKAIGPLTKADIAADTAQNKLDAAEIASSLQVLNLQKAQALANNNLKKANELQRAINEMKNNQGIASPSGAPGSAPGNPTKSWYDIPTLPKK